MLYSDSSSGMDTFEAMRQDQTQAFGIGSDNLYSVDKRTDMDLISQQRPPNDSGNASASSGGTAVATQQISTRATNFVPVNSNDADKTLLANSPASMEGDASSDAMAMVMSPVHSQSQLRPFSDEASSGFISGPGAQNRGLGQHLANSSSIMSFSAGIETNFDSSNEGSSGGNGSNSDSPVCTVRNLIGASVTTGAKLNNVDGSLGIFFVFPDLSVRKDGDYRFRFSFFDLKR
ncbi:hypothetical protein GGI07_001896 [Coemansia sp. Benny D115]|nr:hypothetical protein GGI07_001896 [Coemansia sp. Benny D115]